MDPERRLAWIITFILVIGGLFSIALGVVLYAMGR